MNGKKVAIFYVGLIIVVCILIFVVMQIFFANYNPKEKVATLEASTKILIEEHPGIR